MDINCHQCGFSDLTDDALGPLTECSNCLKWYHNGCADIIGAIEEDEDWYCPTCRDIDCDEDLEVEKIINHRITVHGRQFRIKWKNYGNKKNSWANETDLDECIGILNNEYASERVLERQTWFNCMVPHRRNRIQET